MYKPGGPIIDALTCIQNNKYVLPAIQREFVWQPEQIAKLFDSLMQDYPIGTFLFWNVDAANSHKFKFYGFVRDYHKLDNPHCPDLGLLPNQNLTAILDGQQRLTALNIGLRGSMAVKLPYKWWSSPDAFPKCYLYLDLLAENDTEHEDSRYRLKFLEPAKAQATEAELWFKVPDVLKMEDGPAMLEWITEHHPGLSPENLKKAFRVLSLLHKTVHIKPLVHYYEEASQDIEKVLNIFIRLNSGGTVLSYSDLLLSVAVAQWSKLDARQEIHSLVDQINHIRDGFGFSKDFVLKAGLMLADISSVGFKVENFNHENMQKLESLWPKIRDAITLAASLVSDFGLNSQTLRADSAVLPIAYYLYRHGYSLPYLTQAAYETDRTRIKGWLFRSLLKPSGIWGSGLDTLLTALRAVINNSPDSGFPVEALNQTMRQRGKSLTFEQEEIEELASMKYGDKRVFLLLSLLYPFVDLKNQFHIDHIFPRSQFKPTQLKKFGFEDAEVETLREWRDQLPNLQLLEGKANIQKQSTLPMPWLRAKYSVSGGTADEAGIQDYCDRQDLGDLPEELKDFRQFYEARHGILKSRITSLINTM
jgi:hypothetical protein